MKKSILFVLALAILFNCKKSTKPIIPGWEVLSIGTNVDLFVVDFVDENYGWVIGRDTVVYHTTDGGNTWVRQSYPLYTIPYARLHDIHFIDRQLGWAVGSAGDGLIYKTTDGGQNWFIQDTLKGTHLNCVIFTDPRHGWVCEGSILLNDISYFRTTDGGETWLPMNVDVFLRDFVDSLNGWAFGQGNSILHTSDGGLSWVNIYPGPVGSGTLDFVDLYHGWGLMGARVSEYETWYWVIHTNDGGYSWESQLDTFKSPQSAICCLTMLNSTTGWISKGENKIGTILHTTNGGNRWSEQPLPSLGGRAILDMEFVNENNGWAIGTQGLILRTKNGGNPIR